MSEYRLDDLQLNGLFIYQNPSHYRFGEDAVLLSNFTEVRRGENAMDLCTGSGIIPILLSAKTEGKSFAGIEIQCEVADMARRSVLLNALQDRIKIECMDIKEAPAAYGTGAFDVVTANPPYLNGGKLNESESISISRHEIKCAFGDVAEVSAKLLKRGGRFYLVHRPHRLADIFYSLRINNMEPKILQTVHPSEGKPPSLVLIAAVKGGKPHLKIMPPMIL